MLVHEVTHVWQFQNRGVRYISEGVYAQVFVDDEYNWETEIETRNKKDWVEFNREAQSQFFEDLHKHGRQVDRTISPPGGDVPGSYDFAGAFFVEPKDSNLEPIFPFHSAPVSPPFPASGHIFRAITEFTEIGIKATETVREG